MNDFSIKDILSLDKATYSKHFKSAEFGLALGSEHFLKITPPFYSGSIEAEIAATKIIGNQLSFSIPNILVNDQIDNWKYVITKNVNGQQAKNVYRTMTPENVRTFAKDIGKIIKGIHDIKSNGFERDFGPWSTYLESNLKNQKAIHLTSNLRIPDFIPSEFDLKRGDALFYVAKVYSLFLLGIGAWLILSKNKFVFAPGIKKRFGKLNPNSAPDIIYT